MCFCLSSRGLGNVNYENFKNDFTFAFINKSFICPLFLAEFLSPKVAKLRKSDSSLKKLSFRMKINKEETIDQINKLVHGETIQIHFEEDEVIQILLQIGNNEILSSNVFSELTFDNSLKLLELKRSHGFDFSKEIEFCASNFESLKKNNFSPEILSFVLDSPSLKLSNEGSLLTFVTELMKNDKSYSSLLRFIKCEYLLPEEIELYITFLDSLDPETIGFLWPSLRLRFLKSYPPPNINRHQSNILREDMNTQIDNTQEIDSLKQQLSDKSIEIENLQNDIANFSTKMIEEKEQLNRDKQNEIIEIKKDLYEQCQIKIIKSNPGIIKSLTDQFGDDLVKKGIIKMEATSNTEQLNYLFRSLPSHWYSNCEPNSWVKFDFVKKRILLSAYSIEAAYLISFKLEGSNDDSNWVLVDSRNDVPKYISNRERFQEETFMVLSKVPFRFFRIGLVKSDHFNNYYALKKIEFFGTITK